MAEFFTPDLDAAQLTRVRRLLADLRTVPAPAQRYAGVEAVDSVDDLAKVPVLVKDDLQAALAHLEPRAQDGTIWVFQSGGSTGAPQVGYAPTGLYMREVHLSRTPAVDEDVVPAERLPVLVWNTTHGSNFSPPVR